MPLRLVSDNTEATRQLGCRLGEQARGPLAILLLGDYGAGKTTLVQGLARGLGIDQPVRSPSYNIMKIYRTGRLILVHADFYRTAGAPDIEELGLYEAMGNAGVLAVEWPGAYQPSELEMEVLSLGFSLLPATGEVEPAREIIAEGTAGCWAWASEVLNAFAAG